MGWNEEERSGRDTDWEAVVVVSAGGNEGLSPNSGLEFLHHFDFSWFLSTFKKFCLSYLVCLLFFCFVLFCFCFLMLFLVVMYQVLLGLLYNEWFSHVVPQSPSPSTRTQSQHSSLQSNLTLSHLLDVSC